MDFVRFITIYGGLVFLTTWAKAPIRPYILMKGLKQCTEYKDLAVQISNMTAYPAERNVYKVTGVFTFTEQMSHGSKVSVDIKKCPDTTGDIENCKQFVPRFTVNNLCELLKEDNVLSKFTSRIEPPGKCPLTGTYKMNSIPIDASLMDYMPIGNIQSYYVTFVGEYKSKTMFCSNFYIQVRPRRM